MSKPIRQAQGEPIRQAQGEPLRQAQGEARQAPGAAVPHEETAAPPAASSPETATTANDQGVLPRARYLAQRGDVKALVALRDTIAHGAEGRGALASAVNKLELDEFDRYLAQARLLRLKLDAEQFKHPETAASQPR